MLVDIALSFKGSKAGVEIGWDGQYHEFSMRYPEEMAPLDPHGFCYIPLGLISPLVGLGRQSEWTLRIRGVPLTSEDLVIYCNAIRERYVALWQHRLRPLGVPFVMPKLNFDVELIDAHPPTPGAAVGAFFSFGKESQMVRILLSKLFPDKKRVLFKTHEHQYSSHHARYPELLVASHTMRKLWYTFSAAYPDIKRTFARGERRIISIPAAFYGMPLMRHFGTKTWFMGNEYDASRRFVADNGEWYYHVHFYDEGLYYEWLVSQAMKSVVHPDAHMFSPVTMVWENKILEALDADYPDAFKSIIACWDLNAGDPARGKNWCGACDKCMRYWTIYVALLGKVPPFKLTRPWEEFRAELSAVKVGHHTSGHLFSDASQKFYNYRMKFVPEFLRQPLTDFWLKYTTPTDEQYYPANDGDFDLSIGVPLLGDIKTAT